MTHSTFIFLQYDVTCLGCAGGGGEYEVVVGFGWTNGVILDFLKMYGDRFTTVLEPETTTTTTTTTATPSTSDGTTQQSSTVNDNGSPPINNFKVFTLLVTLLFSYLC